MRLLDTFRTLRLPLLPAHEAAALNAVRQVLEEQAPGNDETGLGAHLEALIDRWRNDPSPPPDLAVVVHAALQQANWTIAGQDFLALHRRLIADHFLSFGQASSLLRHLHLISHLGRVELASASLVSQVVHARDAGVPDSWSPFRAVLAELSERPTVTEVHVAQAWDDDMAILDEVFADASDSDCLGIVSESLGALGCHLDLLPDLEAMFGERSESHIPYWQMLHFQCIIPDIADHAVEVAYEFEPRGKAANSLFSRYQEFVQTAQNPFLNNAKSVYSLDDHWAYTKTSAAAQALATILRELRRLGFAERRSAAALLRRLILRLLTGIAASTAPAILRAPEGSTAFPVARRICHLPTESFGIIEQRLVDSIATLLHPASENWVARGIGDAVNATNVSKLKLGDCDFERVSHRECVAYEAHGGTLTAAYVNLHLASLQKTLATRVAGWNIGDTGSWALTINFVCYGAIVQPFETTVAGQPLKIRILTFDQLIDLFLGDQEQLALALRTHLVGAIGRPFVPRKAQDALANLLNA